VDACGHCKDRLRQHCEEQHLLFPPEGSKYNSSAHKEIFFGKNSVSNKFHENEYRNISKFSHNWKVFTIVFGLCQTAPVLGKTSGPRYLVC
jgi:hypothetical protein